MEGINCKFTKIWAVLESDEAYQELEQQRQERLTSFQAVIKKLTEEQRDAIVDYIGISEEQHWRAIELITDSTRPQDGILP